MFTPDKPFIIKFDSKFSYDSRIKSWLKIWSNKSTKNDFFDKITTKRGMW